MTPPFPRALVRPLLLLAAALLACGDDTSVVVAVGDPLPPPGSPPAGGGAVIVVTRTARDRDATATARISDARTSHGFSVHERVFYPSPRGPARIAADDHVVAADPGSGGKNFDADTNVDFGRDVAARHALLRVGLRDIPRRARVLDAKLSILARFADAQPGLSVYAGLVAQDGVWNDRTQPLHWGRAPSFDGIVFALDESGVPLATTGLSPAGSANFGVQDTGDPRALASSSQVGQTLTALRAGPLARVAVQLRRVGTPVGNTRIRIERCRADDGSDDRPDGVPLAVSAPVDASDIGSGLRGGRVGYAFAEPPPLEAGRRYAFVLETDFTGSAAHHLQWKIHHGDLYRDGGLVNFGRKIAWNVVAYPEVSQLPLFFAEDLATPRVAPFGLLTRIDDVPPFPAPDAWVEVADLTAQLQEWVDDPAYRPFGPVAIELFTAPETPPGALRRGKDFRLEVSWREPRRRR